MSARCFFLGVCTLTVFSLRDFDPVPTLLGTKGFSLSALGDTESEEVEVTEDERGIWDVITVSCNDWNKLLIKNHEQCHPHYRC